MEHLEQVEKPQGMSTAAKIAIGCGVVFLFAVLAVGGCVYIFGKKGLEMTQQIKEIKEAPETPTAAALEAARTNSYTPSDDGVITEERLRTYLAVREEVGAVYGAVGQFWDEMVAHRENPDVELTDVFNMFGSWAEVKRTWAQSLERNKMHPDEYLDITAQVYWNWLDTRPGGPPPEYMKMSSAKEVSIPEENKQLFNRYKEKIDALALGAIDLLLFEMEPDDFQQFPTLR